WRRQFLAARGSGLAAPGFRRGHREGVRERDGVGEHGGGRRAHDSPPLVMRPWGREARRDPPAGPSLTRYCSRLSASCGCALACASTATPACWSTCAFVSCAVSAAKSASSIRPRDAARFSLTVCRFTIVDSKRFWIAPSVPRSSLTVVNTVSTRAIAKFEPATVAMLTSANEPESTALVDGVAAAPKPSVLPFAPAVLCTSMSPIDERIWISP